MKVRHYLVLATWLIGTIMAFAYFTLENLAEFDPIGQLSEVNRANVEKTVLGIAQSATSEKMTTVISFVSPNCHCNQVSQRHIDSVAALTKRANLRYVTHVVNDNSFIPSTPAVAIVSESEGLLYLGPYGAGIGCSKTNGFAKTVLNNYIKGYSSPMVVSDVKGCYCNV